jgi:hypothetical protein
VARRASPALAGGAVWLSTLAVVAALAFLPGRVTAAAPAPAGFTDPVPIIPEIGLWVDGSARIGFAKKSGLVLWWGLEPSPAAAAVLDWHRVTYRIRAEVFRSDGKRVAKEETLVEPLHSDGARERGGFPTPLELVLAPGDYRIHLEGYPLVSAKDAGLDSVPRGTADVEVSVPEMNVGSAGWRLSDILLLDSVRKWEAGAAPERTWYDWVGHPCVSRTLVADTLKAYAGFEVLRSAEVVPRCGPGRCRVMFSVRDAQDGVVLQELRPVPEAGSLQPYMIPFSLGAFAPGAYTFEVEVFEGADLQVAARRRFRVVAPGP